MNLWRQKVVQNAEKGPVSEIHGFCNFAVRPSKKQGPRTCEKRSTLVRVVSCHPTNCQGQRGQNDPCPEMFGNTKYLNVQKGR
jgi:hypothetical protein